MFIIKMPIRIPTQEEGQVLDPILANLEERFEQSSTLTLNSTVNLYEYFR